MIESTDGKNRAEEITERKYAHLSMQELFEDELLETVLTVVQDGICFLSAEFDILYLNPAMRFWYGVSRDTAGPVGEKCYRYFHGLDHPCEGCPAREVLDTGKPASGERLLEVGDRREGWHNVFCAPVLDGEGRVMMLIEYVRDITDEKKGALSVELMQEQVQSVMEIMEQKEAERKSREQKLIGNMNKSIDTVSRYLKKVLDDRSYGIIMRQMELTKLGTEKNTEPEIRLSGQELQIARYISKGYLSKEIADELCISKKTVDYHRTNLRKKFKLGQGEHLRDALRDYLIRTGL